MVARVTKPLSRRLPRSNTGGMARAYDELHDGFAFDFVRHRYHTKVKGQPAKQYVNVGDIFTITRNSARGSYRGPDGYIAYVQENQFQRSQEFDNAYWTKSQTTVSANAVIAPDGTLTADTIIEDTSNNIHVFQRSAAVVGLTQTLSIHVKLGTATWVYIQLGAVASYFNVATGAWGTIGSGHTVAKYDLGGGWFRLAVTARPANANCIFGIANGDSQFSYLGSSRTMHFWGAQLQHGKVLHPYLASSATAKYDQARFDWDVNGKPLGLLIENGRTNLLARSEDFTSGLSWSATAATVTVDAVNAPDNTVAGDALVEDNTNALHYVVQNISGTADNTVYTFSVFVKAAGRTWCHLETRKRDGATFVKAYYNLSGAGAVGTIAGGATCTITRWVDDWYRVTLSVNMGAGATTPYLMIASATGDGGRTYLGTSITSLYMWGAQCEVGSTDTSYIPTSSSTLARASDNLSRTLLGEVLTSAGTLFFEYDAIGFSPVGGSVCELDDGGTTNWVTTSDNGAGNYERSVRSGGAYSASWGATIPARGVRQRDAIAYAANDFRYANNGALSTADTSGAVPATLNRMTIGFNSFGGTVCCHVRSAEYWPERLPDDVLQRLTA